MTPPTPMLDAGFRHITEREPDGTWEDCTWAAGLEWFRLCYDESIPATHVEMQALRAASGEPLTGGSNIGNLRDGIRARYNVTVVGVISGIAALKAALKPNHTAVIQGSMTAFGPSHHLSVWQPSFDGAHAVLLTNIGGALYWCDPEAPAGADVPVRTSWAEVDNFVNAFAGQHLVAPIKQPVVVKEDIMPVLITYTPGYTAEVKSLSNIRSGPAGTATKLRMVPANANEKVVLTGTVRGTVDPATGSDVWYCWYGASGWEYTAKDNLINGKPASGPPSAFTAATQAAAVTAAVQAQIAADLTILNKAVESATTTSTHAERERLAQAVAERIRTL